jgi:homoserine O-acetyltransferase
MNRLNRIDFALAPTLRIGEAQQPSSPVVHFPASQPLALDCGQLLGPFSVAYQTYGELNPERSNAILVCHALTGDQHVANVHPVTGKPGWWETMVGPGKPIDTNRFFVICPNIIGGCMGSTGPASVNPKTGAPYGLSFPVITIGDMVDAQVRLIDHLGIDQLFAVTGGSMGGMQVLEWAARHGERVFSAVPIATAAWHSSQNIAFHEVGRQAVMADPDWCEGNYLERGVVPRRGLAVARMAAHITYLSEEALHHKFGRNFQDRTACSFSFVGRRLMRIICPPVAGCRARLRARTRPRPWRAGGHRRGVRRLPRAGRLQAAGGADG